MPNTQKIKTAANVLPAIIQYGSGQILLQSSMKPEVLISTHSAIKILKDVAYHHKIISLSANQIGVSQRLFVSLKPQFMVDGKWANYQEQFQKHQIKCGDDAYQAIISPLEINSSFQHYYGFQECPSMRGLKFKVKIPIFINVRYLTQKILKTFIEDKKKHPQQKFCKPVLQIPEQLYTLQKLIGFKGRVWDHQIRHLQGLLPIQQKICQGSFYLLDQYKYELQNIQYFEQLKKKYKLFQQKNLQKFIKQHEDSSKTPSSNKLKNINQINQLYKQPQKKPKKQKIKKYTHLQNTTHKSKKIII